MARWYGCVYIQVWMHSKQLHPVTQTLSLWSLLHSSTSLLLLYFYHINNTRVPTTTTPPFLLFFSSSSSAFASSSLSWELHLVCRLLQTSIFLSLSLSSPFFLLLVSPPPPPPFFICFLSTTYFFLSILFPFYSIQLPVLLCLFSCRLVHLTPFSHSHFPSEYPCPSVV